MEKYVHIPATLKEALDLHHGRIRHMHWTTPVKDKAGTVIGMQHHHLLHEYGLKTGVYSMSTTARDDLAQLLVGYYPEMQGSLVAFGGRRGFDIKSEISEEDRRVRERAAKAAKDRPNGKKRGRGRKMLEESIDTAA